MTDYQFSSIIEMIDILLEGCSDITEARKKLARLKKNPLSNDSERRERQGGLKHGFDA
ncbi:MAG: hypothetical protein IJ682_11050 [Lachnospiraceae bacterium]|nr:hypothetical protein [Lachnospiraceae bacterium]